MAAVRSEVRSLGPARQWELTARLAKNYPPGLSRKLWAYRHGGGASLRYRDTAVKRFGGRRQCRRPSRLKVQVRNLRRNGTLQRLLWAQEMPDGSVLLETYCQRRGKAAAFRVTCPVVDGAVGAADREAP